MRINWFQIAIIILQTASAVTYLYGKKIDMGLLILIYAISNVIIFKMGMR